MVRRKYEMSLIYLDEIVEEVKWRGAGLRTSLGKYPCQLTSYSQAKKNSRDYLPALRRFPKIYMKKTKEMRGS